MESADLPVPLLLPRSFVVRHRYNLLARFQRTLMQTRHTLLIAALIATPLTMLATSQTASDKFAQLSEQFMYDSLGALSRERLASRLSLVRRSQNGQNRRARRATRRYVSRRHRQTTRLLRRLARTLPHRNSRRHTRPRRRRRLATHRRSNRPQSSRVRQNSVLQTQSNRRR